MVQAVHRIAPKARITGLDVDGDNLAWCRDKIPYASFMEVPLLPPAPVPDFEFDLLYGISVFAHLTRDAFNAWCNEICRIVRPGGVVLVTINGGASLARTGNEPLITRALDSGFDDASADHSLDGKISDPTYYRVTYMSTAEVARIFGAHFIIRDILPQGSGSSQDIVVCQRG